MTLLESRGLEESKDPFDSDEEVLKIRAVFDAAVERIHDEFDAEMLHLEATYDELRAGNLSDDVQQLLVKFDQLLSDAAELAQAEHWTTRAAVIGAASSTCNRLESQFKLSELAGILRRLISAPVDRRQKLQQAADDCRDGLEERRQKIQEAMVAERAEALAEPAAFPLPEADSQIAPTGDGEPADHRGTESGKLTAALRASGRLSAPQSRLSPRAWVAIIAVVLLVAVVGAGFFIVNKLEAGPGYTPTELFVQGKVKQACANRDVVSEPGQVNFACARGTRRVLTVFALLTSGGHADFVNKKTGREGLEPIAPKQGGSMAWALNFHHSYNPLNPVDSMAVAARSINNIIGGATVTGKSGKSKVLPGLESKANNCLRYTGSASLKQRQGYPSLCAKPLTKAGQAELVHDVFLKWVVDAQSTAVRDAVTLFETWHNPADPSYQRVMEHLPHALN